MKKKKKINKMEINQIMENWKKSGFAEFIFNAVVYYYKNKHKRKSFEATSMARRDIKNIEGFLRSQLEEFFN